MLFSAFLRVIALLSLLFASSLLLRPLCAQAPKKESIAEIFKTTLADAANSNKILRKRLSLIPPDLKEVAKERLKQLAIVGEAMVADDADAEELKKELKSVLIANFVPDANLALPGLFVAEPELDFSKLVMLTVPVTQWQSESNKNPKLDGSLFVDFFYEGKDRRLVALVEDAAQQPELVKLVKLTDDKKITLGSVVNKQKLLPTLQKKLANDRGLDSALCQRSRLDRVYWARVRNTQRVEYTGVSIAPATAKATLNARLEVEVADIVEELKKNDLLANLAKKPPVADGGLTMLADPLKTTQESLAGDAVLDGSFLHTLRYDEQGSLILTGLLGEESARAALVSRLSKELLDKKIIREGEDLRKGMAGVVSVEWAKKLQTLREDFAKGKGRSAIEADPLRRTWIQRAFFERGTTEEDRVTATIRVQAICLDSPKNAEPLRKELTEAFSARLPDVRKLRYEAELGKAEKIAETFAITPILELQKKVIAEKLDGSLFTDATYTAEGTLVLAAMAAEPRHRESLEKLGANARLSKQLLPKDKVEVKIAESEQTWTKFLSESRMNFRLGNDDLSQQTRLDRAWLDYGADRGELHIHFAGVCILLADKTQTREAIDKRLAEVRPAIKQRPKVVSTELVHLDNPSRMLQDALEGEANPARDGMLFGPATFAPAGNLQIPLMVADAKQTAIAATILERRQRDIPEAIGRTGAKLDAPTTFDLANFIVRMSSRLADDAKIGRYARLDRGYFVYSKEHLGKLDLLARGLLIFVPGGVEDESELTKFYQKEARFLLPDSVGDLVIVRAKKDMIINPASKLQQRVAQIVDLDGVGISQSYFDARRRLVFAGVWRGIGQKDRLTDITKLYLSLLDGDPAKNGLEFQCESISSDTLLKDLRRWTAEKLEETWIERLYFDARGTLKIQGYFADPADQAKIKAKLQELIQRHPQFKGRYTLENLQGRRNSAERKASPELVRVAFVAPPIKAATGPAPMPEPVLDLRGQKPLAPLVRESLQGPLKDSQPLPLPEWDGLRIERGSYTAEGKFNLVGLCDTEEQKNQLVEYLTERRNKTDFRDALARGIELADLKSVPLAPMLERLRKVMPYIQSFDGLKVVGAHHDVENRLVLRSHRIGELADDAKPQMQKLLQGHPLYRERVTKGLRWYFLTKQDRDITIAPPLLRKALNDLREALYEPKGADPEKEQTRKTKAINRAEESLTTSLSHDPKVSTTWYARAMVELLNGDEQAATRDLRRMVLLENAPETGDERRRDRLRMTEKLQGEVRRKLNRLHLQAMREVDAAKLMGSEGK
jgi:hypothetical protein